VVPPLPFALPAVEVVALEPVVVPEARAVVELAVRLSIEIVVQLTFLPLIVIVVRLRSMALIDVVVGLEPVPLDEVAVGFVLGPSVDDHGDAPSPPR
jgi:hypothetical protein